MIFNGVFLSNSTGRFMRLQVLFLWSLLAATSLSVCICDCMVSDNTTVINENDQEVLHSIRSINKHSQSVN